MIKRESIDNIIFAMAKSAEGNDENITYAIMREYHGKTVAMHKATHPAAKFTSKDGQRGFMEKVEKIISSLFLDHDGIENISAPPMMIRKVQSSDGRTVMADEEGQAMDTSIADAMKNMGGAA